MTNYQPVIGLEVHIELGTKSKMFCSCNADYFGKEPNTHTCPICLGLPGALPKANEKAIEFTQKLGLALNCRSILSSKFDRKNYFYPDLSKGFQISQYDLPFSQKGFLTISVAGKSKKIGITRVHLEEDTGKLSHTTIKARRVTLIDFNRSGVPLVEAVSEPQMNSAAQAKAYAQKLQQLARYLEISDADMEKGSMRIEPNVSLRKIGEKKLPNYKVELKNINSFRFVEKAIEYEIERQAEILNRRETPVQETRGWNDVKNQTVSQRSKEESHDYRYFPEPDLPPFAYKKEYLLELKRDLPELPDVKVVRFTKDYQLSLYEARILIKDYKLANYFEEAVAIAKSHQITPKQVANFLINKKPDFEEIAPSKLVTLITSVTQKVTIASSELERVIQEVINQNPQAVQDYQNGKVNALMFLLGRIVKKTSANIDHNEVKLVLEEKLRG